MGLSQSHDLGNMFDMLSWVDLNSFFLLFKFNIFLKKIHHH